MDIYHDIDAWRRMNTQRLKENTVGFVPTMGNLHVAHLSLVKQSQQENRHTAVSIFINQAQFNNPEDFIKYPRTLDADLEQLERAGVDYCLIPSHEMLYPDAFCYQIHETTNHQQLEGLHRPGHFTGVLTIVMKLLNLVKPNRAYFGEKDYEQFQYIRDMARAFFLETEIISCPTLRETSGLAFSSRNGRLSAAGKEKAALFAQIFLNARSVEDARAQLSAADIQIDYIEEHAGRRFAAVFIDEVRLIDNYAITRQSPQHASFAQGLADA